MSPNVANANHKPSLNAPNYPGRCFFCKNYILSEYMSGHSKWSQIKRKKGVEDARRAKAFTKIAQAVALAAREGGPDPATNPKLRLAIDKSREVNMPAANIERAINRGSGKLGGAELQELTIEGYGPGGAALLVSAISDNRNRTVSEIRHLLDIKGGKMAGEGSVRWMFEFVGKITIDPKGLNHEDVELQAIEAGASDIFDFEEEMLVISSPQDMETVKTNLKETGIEIKNSTLGFIPKTLVSINPEEAEKINDLVEALEDMDDVQEVVTNMSSND